jgi:hypothetical protein
LLAKPALQGVRWATQCGADASSNRASGDCDHDVSIRIATVGRYRGARPRSKISMMIMRPQQQGQGCERICGSLSSALSASLD